MVLVFNNVVIDKLLTRMIVPRIEYFLMNFYFGKKGYWKIYESSEAAIFLIKGLFFHNLLTGSYFQKNPIWN